MYYNKKVKKNKAYSFITKILIIIVVTLILLITLKSNPKFKDTFYKYVYEKNFSFTSLNKWYEKTFGSSIPFKDIIPNDDKTVFEEKLVYSESSLYKDGVKLTVENNYLVPAIKGGIVIFIGEKAGYGNTIIVQQNDGIDLWYSNMKNVNVKLYDYIESSKLLGESNGNFLYLIYKKDGKVLDYKEYLI